MPANKLENFEIQEVHRSQIVNADYNPRKISKEAEKKLRNFLKEYGLWQPLTWNVRTMTLVSGHQRLAIMDSLMRTDDYDLTMSVVDVDERTELKGNVFMNNTSAQGEWDFEVLTELRGIFPDIDYENELGFSAEEVELFIEPPQIDIDEPSDFQFDDEHRDAILPPAPPKKEVTEEEKQEFRDAKKKARETAKQDNLDGRGFSFVDSDYALSVIFTSADEKKQFLELIEADPSAKRILAEQLLKALND